ncbi:MAG: hypothetical protein AAGE96_22005 [Cyanobacteria bacterium P01_G01_bin.19]
MSNISFSQLIHKVDIIESACIRDEIKLRRSGELIHRVSEQILQKANTLLEKSHSLEIDETDTQIDRSFSNFLSSLTQQSISTNFLAKYLQPQARAEYHRETTKSIKFLSATEALDELGEDLIESELFTLAHDENIDKWVLEVEEFIGDRQQATLAEIVERLKLTKVQIFIALLFGNFELSQSSDFYNGFDIKIKSIHAKC